MINKLIFLFTIVGSTYADCFNYDITAHTCGTNETCTDFIHELGSNICVNCLTSCDLHIITC